jgi:phosphoenolpyruvate-protein phosphotransferase (PTS system enzyme I)
LLKTVIDSAHNANIPVSMCGEMSSEPLYTVLLLGLGLDEFSVSPVVLPEIKKVIRAITQKEAKIFVKNVLKLTTGREIDEYAKKLIMQILPERYK